MLYEYIKGKVTDTYEDKLVLECNGIGYAIFISANALANLVSKEDETILYIHENIREDEMSLYGFSDKTEREIFRMLLSISGIGPKVSIGILSKFTVDELIKYISIGDEKALSSAPGIGKKTANRIILELKDKFKNYVGNIKSEVNSKELLVSGIRDDAIDALMSLGYTYNESDSLISRVYKEDMKLEDLLKQALSAKQ